MFLGDNEGIFLCLSYIVLTIIKPLSDYKLISLIIKFCENDLLDWITLRTDLLDKL